MTANWPRLLQALTPRLAESEWLVMDPPANVVDQFGENHRIWTSSFACWSRVAPERRHPFGLDPPSGPTAQALVFQSRSRARFQWQLQQLANWLPGQELIIAGAHREGGKVTPGIVREVLDSGCRRLARQGRGTLWAVDLPHQGPGREEAWRTVEMAGFALETLPGVFGHGGLDDGTALLINALDTLDLKGPVLDFACGTGILGLAATRRQPTQAVTATDSDALALASAARNLASHGRRFSVVPSDGWSAISGRFATIVSNPPFHEGSRPDLRVAEDLIHRAPEFLDPGGQIVLVANRHLPLERILQKSFTRGEKIAENTRFKILRGLEPARS